MTDYDLYQADAFTGEVFKGNPAAVMPLTQWLPDDTLQAIAVENNLAETAFVIKRDHGQYDLRWFTPGAEVELCGHATLATAHILFTERGEGSGSVTFSTRSGNLTVHKENDHYVMDFPAYLDPAPANDRAGEIEEVLGIRPVEVLSDAFLLAVLEDAGSVRSLTPNLFGVQQLKHHAHDGCLLVTAPGDQGYDFVSRFFAPALGIPEDPVTGSAHCMTSPYWAERFGKNRLKAFQASSRGGEVLCEVNGPRITLKGQAVTYLRGRISF